jgi:hypothetical protein
VIVEVEPVFHNFECVISVDIGIHANGVSSEDAAIVREGVLLS